MSPGRRRLLRLGRLGVLALSIPGGGCGLDDRMLAVADAGSQADARPAVPAVALGTFDHGTLEPDDPRFRFWKVEIDQRLVGVGSSLSASLVAPGSAGSAGAVQVVWTLVDPPNGKPDYPFIELNTAMEMPPLDLTAYSRLVFSQRYEHDGACKAVPLLRFLARCSSADTSFEGFVPMRPAWSVTTLDLRDLQETVDVGTRRDVCLRDIYEMAFVMQLDIEDGDCHSGTLSLDDIRLEPGGAVTDGGTGPGSTVAACLGTAPSRALITDFSDATASTPSQAGVAFGSAPDISGRAFAYAAPGLAVPVLTLAPAASPDGGAPSPALNVAVSSGSTDDPDNNGWFGFGLAFDRCVDTRAYRGVQFSIAGDVGNCNLGFGATFGTGEGVVDSPGMGPCTAAACTSRSSYTIEKPGTFAFSFDELMNDSRPVPADARQRLAALRWGAFVHSNGSACSARFTVDDVAFVTEVPAHPVCDVALSSPVVIGEGGLYGSTFTFSAPGLASPVVHEVTALSGQLDAVEITADLGAASDAANDQVGLGFYMCRDASPYAGLKLTVTGDLGTCRLAVSADPTEDMPPSFFFGTCAGPLCRPPLSPPIFAGTTVVRFSEMTGGAPRDGVDLTSLGAVELVLAPSADVGAAPCQASFRVTDVSFVTDAGN